MHKCPECDKDCSCEDGERNDGVRCQHDCDDYILTTDMDEGWWDEPDEDDEA